MENESRNSQSKDMIAVGGPLHLGDAGFLKRELELEGISVKIHSHSPGEKPRDAIHLVMVDPKDHTAATALRKKLLDDHVISESKKNGPNLKKVLIMWVLGIMVGLYVGSKISSKLTWAVLLFGLIGMLAYGTWVHWSESKNRS